MIKIEFPKLKQVISNDESTFLFGITEIYSGSILNVRWYNIYVHSLNGIQTVSSKENCSSPIRVRVRVRVSFRVGEGGRGNFPWGQLSQNLFEYTKNKLKNTLNVDTSCAFAYRQAFKYSRALNMPWIMNMSGFQICQGSLVLKQPILIFKMDFFFDLVSLLKQKLTKFQILVTLNKSLFPGISPQNYS